MFPFASSITRGATQNRVFGSGEVALPCLVASGAASLSRVTAGTATLPPLAASGAGTVNRLASGSAALVKLAASGSASLKYKRTASGSAALVKLAASGSGHNHVLSWTDIDSWTNTSGTTDQTISATTWEAQARSQSSQVTIDAVSVYIKRSGTGYGTLVVSLFPGEGTIGSTGKGYTGALPAATTTGIACSAISTSYGWVRFDFASPFTWYPASMTDKMVIALGGNGYTGGIVVALKSGHAGNYCRWDSTWSYNASYDMLFKLSYKSWS